MNIISKSHGKVIQKTLAVICLLCLLLSYGAVMVSARDVNITSSSCTVERKATASISFNLKDNAGIYALVLKIGYDSSVLTLKSVSNGSVFPDSEIVMSPLTANPYTYTGYASGISNTTANGTIITFNFTVNENAAFGTYPVTVTQATGYNDAYEQFNIASVNGSVTVVDCIHAEKEWRTTVAAECEKAGTEALTCKKCGDTFETRAISATGHQHTEVRNAVAATETTEGYTGDIYCTVCNKLISKGEVIEKIEPPVTNPPETEPPVTNPPETEPPVTNPPETEAPVTNPPETEAPVTNPPETEAPVTNLPETTAGSETSGDNKPQIISGTDIAFRKNSGDSLIFISDADFNKFIRVEIDGSVLSEEDFTAESGSTKITVKSDFLNKLSNGIHTISIVSASGTASTQFTVQNGQDTTDTDAVSNTDEPTSEIPNTGDVYPYAKMIITVVAFFVLLAGVATVLYLIQNRRYR